MTETLWVATTLAGVAALASLAFALMLARRYRELRDGLVAAGVLGGRPAPARSAAAWLPAPGTPVPADLRMSTLDGVVLGASDFAGDDVMVAFLTSDCTSCRSALPRLSAALEAVPAGAPRPVVVLTGDDDDWPRYLAAVSGLARVVGDREPEKGRGVADVFGVRAYPAVLVVGGGIIRRAGMTASDVAPIDA